MRKILRRFEEWIAGLLEGRLGALLGARLQPADIARRLEAHLEDHAMVGAGTRYAPNRYRVYLAPETLSTMAAYRADLERELARHVHTSGARLGAAFLGSVGVACLPDARLGRAALRIESDIVGADAGDLSGPDGATMAIPVAAPTSAAPRRLVLETPAGPHLLEPGSGALTLGRSLENDLIFDSPSVSRNHARLIPQGAHWLVEDMGSKHGVFVNDRRIISGLLRPGDRLRLGRLTLPVRRDGDAGPSDSPRGGASDDSGSATP